MNLELFGCSGGMSLGFKRAGIEFDISVDYSADAVESYAANIGHRPVQMDVRDLVRLARLGAFRPEIDLLVADPPCTPWSSAGKRRGLDDERDMLRDTCDLIALLRPRQYLIGNVPGLDTKTGTKALEVTIGRLREHGYCTTDYVSLNAADYGVPQCRRRPFWFGHLEGPCLRWPEPTHGDVKFGQVQVPGTELKPWVTCRDALQHLPIKDLGRPIVIDWKPAKHHRPSKPDRPGRTITSNPNTDGALLSVLSQPRDAHPPSKEDRPAGTLTTREGRGASVLRHEWPWDRPATTVTSREALGSPGHHDPDIRGVSGVGAVVLSERAGLILQGFPENWKLLSKTKRGRWAMLGMAMPPPLAESVARAIVRRAAALRGAA